MIRCLHLSNSRQSQIKITEVWQHSLTVLSRCTRKIDVWILCVTKAGTFDAIVGSKALCGIADANANSRTKKHQEETK